MDRLNEDRAFGPFFHSHRVQIENGIFSSILHIMYSLRPVLFAHLELSVKTRAAAKMTLLPVYESDCAEAEDILRIDRKHRLLF